MEYFGEVFLKCIGERIGKPIKIDDTMLVGSKGMYACPCVEVDLDKPLLSKFRLRCQIQRIEYEAMHTICFQCGKYGHRRENCSMYSDRKASISGKQ